MDAAVKTYNDISYVNGSLARSVPLSTALPRVEGVPGGITLPKEKAREKKAKMVKAKHNVSAFAVVGYVTITALLMLLIFSYVRLFEISAETSERSGELETLIKNQAVLRAEYEGLIDLNDIETRAKNEIGMTKPRDGQIIYVDLSNPDEAILSESKDSDRLFSVLDAFKESLAYVKAYFE